MNLSASKLLAIIATVVFAIAAFNGNIGSIALVPLGLTFLAGAHAVS